MPEVIIADTSVLVVFSKIDAIDLLRRLYGEICVTREVADEYAEPLPAWIVVKSPKDKRYLALLQTQVDKGEASSIALACDFDDVLLLLDDLKARKLAVKLGFRITGTPGVIAKAKKIGMIERVKPYVEKLQQTDFRISKDILREFLRINDE